jgi:hypothetical protein
VYSVAKASLAVLVSWHRPAVYTLAYRALSYSHHFGGLGHRHSPVRGVGELRRNTRADKAVPEGHGLIGSVFLFRSFF